MKGGINMEKQRLSIVLNKEIYEKLRLYCFENRISMNKLVENTITKYLLKKER
jgi:hypothetical protein